MGLYWQLNSHRCRETGTQFSCQDTLGPIGIRSRNSNPRETQTLLPLQSVDYSLGLSCSRSLDPLPTNVNCCFVFLPVFRFFNREKERDHNKPKAPYTQNISLIFFCCQLTSLSFYHLQGSKLLFFFFFFWTGVSL